jgi:hypothetical protein
MKARLLQKLLGTDRPCTNHKEYIAVGSALCHDLFSVNKVTLKVKYALDTWGKGRESLMGKSNDELLGIYDKLHEMIASGEIRDIIDGDDVIENQLTVYTVTDGQLVKTFTDAYGWPNVTVSGVMMYNNDHFKTEIEAIEDGISEYESGAKMMDERIAEIEADLEKAKARKSMYEGYVVHLKSLK